MATIDVNNKTSFFPDMSDPDPEGEGGGEGDEEEKDKDAENGPDNEEEDGNGTGDMEDDEGCDSEQRSDELSLGISLSSVTNSNVFVSVWRNFKGGE